MTISYLEAVAITDVDGKSRLVAGAFVVRNWRADAGLVGDADDIFASEIAHSGFAVQGLAAELVDDAEAVHAATAVLGPAPAHLLPDLLADDDAIHAAAALLIPLLLPALFAADDSIFEPTVVRGAAPVRTLSAPFVATDDAIYSSFATLVGVGGGPQQKLKPPPKHQDTEAIYAPSLSKHTGLVTDQDVIRAPLVTALAIAQAAFVDAADEVLAASIANFAGARPALLASDDEMHAPLISMIVQPELLANDDAVLMADVGWQVIAEMTEDLDAVHGVAVSAFNDLLPETYADEETIDTYPFFLQSLQGGVSVPPSEDVLEGSIRRPIKLKGSIATRRRAA